MDRETLDRIAHNRLYPSLRNPNYLVLRSRRLILARYFETLPDNLLVLDVGGRYQPYRPLLAGKAMGYVALDVEPTEYVNAVGNAERLPFRGETFDLVIATCVFDYIQRPYDAAAEIQRVLKAKGTFIGSFGAAVPRFGDDECWRFLPRGLNSLFASFRQVKVIPELSSIGGFCRLMNLGLRDLLRLRVLQLAYESSICPVLNLIGLALETAHLTSSDTWAGNYTVIAIK